jgi:hypothetical protein
MRSLAGAIVVLAGSVLAGASVVAEELARNGNHFVGVLTSFAEFGGAVLIIGGLIVFVADLFSGLFPSVRPSEP